MNNILNRALLTSEESESLSFSQASVLQAERLLQSPMFSHCIEDLENHLLECQRAFAEEKQSQETFTDYLANNSDAKYIAFTLPTSELIQALPDFIDQCGQDAIFAFERASIDECKFRVASDSDTALVFAKMMFS